MAEHFTVCVSKININEVQKHHLSMVLVILNCEMFLAGLRPFSPSPKPSRVRAFIVCRAIAENKKMKTNSSTPRNFSQFGN